MRLDYQRIGVMGFSPRTGLEVIKYLSKFDLKIIVADQKDEEELLPLIKKLDNSKLEYDLGTKGTKILESELIILSPGVPYDLDILVQARKKGIETISEIEFAFRQSQAEIIAITGTNGKTTTTEMLAAMLADLEAENIKAAGNIGIPFISLIDQLKEKERVILELSSFQLEAVKDFKAKIALYLNYSPDHLDRHQTEKNYQAAKANIFKNQQPSDFAIIDLDDPYLSELKNKLEAKVLTISAKNEKADLIIQDNIAYYQKEKLKLLDLSKINLLGKHNQKNAAFAALAAYLAGQKPEKIQLAAQNYKLKAHRMEVIANKNNKLIINDSKATNPDSTLKAINSLEKDIILIAGGQDRKADFSVLKSEIEKKVKTLILLGENKKQLANIFLDSKLKIIEVETMKTAVTEALKHLDSNSVLLLSPASPSWDLYASYKERGNIFKENVLKNID
ncbi:UDP-N-acetylmuramoyl-L-alanine--D-glutamate ligase [Halanaerobium praevalens]|uniref:UDP-N-acetylmuramoylalanine--D-glutamate ligase n=1 Tax=Halanaerobium praevalens (strain ATCC 33744 / DSM 2228 / GSL) TaxID=572479 RepID=E3DQH5_HALPG|nr:UDP-N-acetylmuramoyl-L-alanine--D-glutamate ligase [Halanaerobium praevalens]ADO76871.1 UDP-N-acetylmuramoylalanine/D-glutamate ligase [Halanaerobium praevalens DSM 2228]